MSTVTVQHRVVDSAGNPVPLRAVTATIAGNPLLLDHTTEIVRPVTRRSDYTGLVQLPLTPQNQITTGSYYVIRETGGAAYYCVVPGSGPVWLGNILVDPATLAPAPPPPSLYLTRAELAVANGVASLGADGIVPVAQLPPGSTVDDATTIRKGIVQLAGDLAGTASTPTVPGLASRQPLDSDLTTIAALSPVDGSVLARVAGAWGSTVLTKSDVGLGSVDNTTDAGKPVSTAQQTALNLKAPIANPAFTGTATAPRLIIPPVTLTDAATIATDAGLSCHFRVTLGGNRTLGNPTNPTDGQRVIWELIQDGTGSRIITLDTAFALGADITSVTLSTAAGKRDFVGAIYSAGAGKWHVIALVKGY